MNAFTKIVGSVALALLVSTSAIGAESAGVSLMVFDCQIEIPSGYQLNWTNGGMLQGNYTGKDFSSNPIFQYYPSTEYESLASAVKKILNERSLGEYRHLTVDLGKGVDWDVIVGETSFFAAWATSNSPFVAQFEACAESS